MKEKRNYRLFDARQQWEHDQARIPGGVLLDADGVVELQGLERDTVLVIHCHHGIRSMNVAQQCLQLGFTEVYNLTGGIEAWARDVDPEVPRY